MAWLVNERKLKAAANSMHQFCQQVRGIFPDNVDDRVVEAATVYLYVSLARDLFGQRFAAKLQRKLATNLKYSTAAEVEGHIARLEKQTDVLERAAHEDHPARTPEEIVRVHVVCTIQAMLSDAGFQEQRDQETIGRLYERFERAVKEMRRHLVGIKEANYFVMKSRQAV